MKGIAFEGSASGVLMKLALGIVLITALLASARLYYRAPSPEGRAASRAIEISSETRLGRLVTSAQGRRAGDSGVTPLLDGPDAFAARIALIRAAEQALDVQYYIWQRDVTGLILLEELRKAAERGVRVRLLLDDNGISGLDEDLAALHRIENFEVRLFNPFILRKPKALGYAFDFVRLNRRMHNKSLTADGAASILGGRNIGDIYFGFGSGVQFIDTDVLVAGKIAQEIGADFDRYWHSASAHPVDRIIDAPAPGALERMEAAVAEVACCEEGRLYFERLQRSPLAAKLADGTLELEWTEIALVSDDPAKGLGHAEIRDMLFPRLMKLIERPARSVDIVSAYFVPGSNFAERLQQMAGEGVRIRVLTNSQAATDVVIVHSAYVKYRPELLHAGIGIYELKPEYAASDHTENRIIGGPSTASLHSKSLAIDGERIFIGSFNFDLRSLLLNTEMGVVIESPRLAGRLDQTFSTFFPLASYQPEVQETGRMIWRERLADGSHILHGEEPGTTLASRLTLRFLGLLPIEWLL